MNRFWEGHGFSRADQAPQKKGASAPEGDSFRRKTFMRPVHVRLQPRTRILALLKLRVQPANLSLPVRKRRHYQLFYRETPIFVGVGSTSSNENAIETFAYSLPPISTYGYTK